MTEPNNGLAPENETGKFDELVAVTIRTAVDEWRVHNDPADVHGVSMAEYIRQALADASLLALPHLAHSLCLKWDDTCEGFTIISDGAEAGQVVVLADTIRQVMQERDASLDTLRWLHAEAIWHAERHRAQAAADLQKIAVAMHLKPTAGVDSIVHWAENHVDTIRNLARDRDTAWEALLPLLEQHPLSKDDVQDDELRERRRAGRLAELAADVLRWQADEIERLKDADADAFGSRFLAQSNDIAFKRTGRVLASLLSEPGTSTLPHLAERVRAEFHAVTQQRDEALAALEKQQALLAEVQGALPSPGACSCNPTLVVLHESGSYCGDPQYEALHELLDAELTSANLAGADGRAYGAASRAGDLVLELLDLLRGKKSQLEVPVTEVRLDGLVPDENLERLRAILRDDEPVSPREEGDGRG